MSDYGVLDDEMSDSFPPDGEGLDPYEGQDLDGLLSGEDCQVPEALRPVVPTLDALRAAPMPAELLGEAVARAYFRKVMLDGAGDPPRPNAGGGEAHTLVLPTAAPGSTPHVARPRHRRQRSFLCERWQVKALAGVAVAAVVAGGVIALAHTFSSSGGQPAAAGHSHLATSPTTQATALGSNGVDGSGTPEASGKPGPETSQQPGEAPLSAELCREYFGFITHPGRHVNSATVHEIFRQLNSVAKGQGGVGNYCTRLLQPWAAPQGHGNVGGMPGYQGSQASQDSQGSQGAGSSTGLGGNGGGGSGNG